MACLGSKSSIDLTELSAFVQSMDSAGPGQLCDFLDVRDCRERPGGLGEEAERLVFVVVDRLECLIQVSARVGITFYHGLHQQKPSDRAREAHVLAQRLPDEAGPENPGTLPRQARTPLRWMPQTENAGLERVHLLEPNRG